MHLKRFHTRRKTGATLSLYLLTCAATRATAFLRDANSRRRALSIQPENTPVFT